MKIIDKFEFIENKPARNRIVMPPMDTLMAEDGFANEFHIQHYGARSYGGTGTIIIESTAIEANGRIREKDLGIWKDEHILAFKKVVSVIKMGGALAGLQLNHAGSRTELDLSSDKNVTNHQIFDHKDLTTIKLAAIRDSFIAAAKRAKVAGFDFVELHAAHGYLLSAILSKNSNINQQNMLERAKVIVDIVSEIKDKIKIPVGIRFSIPDYRSNNGLALEDFVPLLKAIDDKVVYFHLSTSEKLNNIDESNELSKVELKLSRVPLAAKLKKIVTKPVIVVGNFETRADVDYALDRGIDAVAMGRAMLFNPNIVVNSLLTTQEINERIYHWNNNIWFDYKLYKILKDRLAGK